MSFSYIPLYIEGSNPSSSGYIPLYVEGGQSIGTMSGNIPIIVGPAIGSGEGFLPLIITGSNPETATSNYLPLFVKVDDTEVKQDNIPLFVQVDETVSGNIPIFVNGVSGESENIPLYISGIGYKLINAGPFDNSDYIPFAAALDIYIRRLTFSEAIDIIVYNNDDGQEEAAGTINAASVISALLSLSTPFPSGSIPLYIRGKP